MKVHTTVGIMAKRKKNADITSLADVLTEDAMYKHAGERSYNRGVEYFQDDQITGLSEHRGKIIATVEGTRNYEVRLWEEDGQLEWSCSCPVGESGDFCKHCVAAGLAWLQEREDGQLFAAEKLKSETTLDDVEKFFSGLPKEDLVETLMELVSSDDELRERYILEAARHKSGGPDFAAYRAALAHALKITGYVSYHDAWDYIWKVQSVVEMLEGFLEDGYALEVRDLAEYALNLMGQSYGQIDDSDGEFGETVRSTLELHHRACELAPPDPETLARKIFEWDMSNDFELFENLTEMYADLLGEKGRAVYRRLAQEEWDTISATKPGKDRSSSESDGRRYRITSIMESFARSSGNIEELVAIKSRNLSKPLWSHLPEVRGISKNWWRLSPAISPSHITIWILRRYTGKTASMTRRSNGRKKAWRRSPIIQISVFRILFLRNTVAGAVTMTRCG
ncbi:MAG: SWIM zinc finger family protein [Candidatus Latescibacterota bacterium]